MDKNAFYLASTVVIEYHEENKYSVERILAIRNTIDTIAELLNSHNWEFSSGFMSRIEKLGGWKYYKLCDMHHVSAMLLKAKETGTTLPKNIRFQNIKMPPEVVEFSHVLMDYIKYLEKLGKGKKTIYFEEWVNRDFLLYLESIGIRDFTDIMVTHLHNYCCIKLSVYSASTKQAIIYRLRHFIKRLLLLGIITNTFLFEALDATVKFPEPIVSILTDAQRKAILTMPEPKTMKEARDAAILRCCLVLGFRNSDVHALRFEEIDWKQEKISIIQQKTRVPLTLPLPKNVGNSIATYILKFRPEVSSPFVFLSTKAPHKPLNRGNDLLCNTLKEIQDILPSKGYHILRRTCASYLLRTGEDLFTISNVLGQRSLSSLDPYLMIDQERMNYTPIDTSFIGLPEVLS